MRALHAYPVTTHMVGKRGQTAQRKPNICTRHRGWGAKKRRVKGREIALSNCTFSDCPIT